MISRKNKNVILSAFLTSCIALLGSGVVILSSPIKVEASSIDKVESSSLDIELFASDEVLAAHNKIEQLRASIKNNYLGLKNVPTWQTYINEARQLTSVLPNGSTKDTYTQRINSAENVVNSVARLAQLETSMANNAHIVKNLPQWQEYFDFVLVACKTIDQNEYSAQHDEIWKRSDICVTAMMAISEKSEGINEGELGN